MLRKFFEPGSWFAAKRYGYGAGLPTAWQGWVLLFAFLLLSLGWGLLVQTGELAKVSIGIAGFILSTLTFALIAKRRTRGGWKWRAGDQP